MLSFGVKGVPGSLLKGFQSLGTKMAEMVDPSEGEGPILVMGSAELPKLETIRKVSKSQDPKPRILTMNLAFTVTMIVIGTLLIPIRNPGCGAMSFWSEDAERGDLKCFS